MRQFDSFADYRAHILAVHQECAKVFPSDLDREFGPRVQATAQPARAPWMLKWCLLFTDDRYVRAWELFDRAGDHVVRERARRIQFSFHYGPTPRGRDREGWPRADRDAGTLLRIDLAPDFADHMHYQGEDHIPQARVKGLTIEDLDPFRFISAVLDHRKSGEPLEKCLGFTLEPRP